MAAREPLTDHPDIIRQWDHEKNTIDPTTLSAGSGRKAWWICDQGHSYRTAVSHRTNSSQCPYCTGNLAVPGVNDITTVYPGIVDNYWDHEKNAVDPSTVTAHSKRVFHWKCNNNHTWTSTAKSIGERKHPCIRCSQKEVSYTYRGEVRNEYINPDLRTIAEEAPEIISWWSENLNESIDPYTTGIGSRKVVWWTCDLGHTWERSVKSFRRNSSCPYCKGTLLWTGFNDIQTTHPHIVKWYDIEKNGGVPPSKVKYNSTEKVWWTCERGHSWLSPVERITTGRGGCAVCSHVYSESHAEKEIKDFLLSVLPEDVAIVTGNRTIISPRELDIYIPEKKIAVEFNGIHWHSDKFLDKNYHYDKWKKCKEQGIQLITIWEDERRDSRDCVKKMMVHKLGVSSGPKVYARNTDVVLVSSDKSGVFMDTHHIQRKGLSGSVSFGLATEKDGQVVAVSTWRKMGDTLYLDRYATSMTVVGGMGKLLKAGIRYAKEQECSQIVTFADHCVSDGGLYEQLGFRLDKELEPDYRYVVGGERVHKFNYRLKRFRDDPELEYVEGMSERELARLNNIPRIYDCGKSRYVYDIS